MNILKSISRIGTMLIGIRVHVNVQPPYMVHRVYCGLAWARGRSEVRGLRASNLTWFLNAYYANIRIGFKQCYDYYNNRCSGKSKRKLHDTLIMLAHEGSIEDESINSKVQLANVLRQPARQIIL